ncbi:MAG: hypothetical protein JRJ00_00210 [Deltaproteobacteria bacterium]|nr:hypothetical protein [Deltaproteobacteria bacterium]
MSGRKRGGSVQVNMLQFYELVQRVEKLEELIKEKPETKTSKEDSNVTKNDVMALLDEKGIKYNPRDKKEVLVELLNEGLEICQKDQTD